jgi:hypothetical protein
MIAFILLAAVSFASALAGVLALLRAGITREESDNSLRGKPATLAGALTRRMVGLYVRMPPTDNPLGDATNQTDADQGESPTTVRPGQ